MTKLLVWAVFILMVLGSHQAILEKKPYISDEDAWMASIVWPFAFGFDLVGGRDD